MDGVFVEDAGDGLGPTHGVSEAGVGADGLDVRGGGELDFFAAFENVLDGEEIIAAALLVESGGLSVAIENAAISEVIIVGGVLGAAPVDELFLDGFAVGMAANGAFAGVAFERGFRCWGGVRLLLLCNVLMLGRLWHFDSPFAAMGDVEFKAALLEQNLLEETLAKEKRKNHLLRGRKRGQVEYLSLNRPKD